MRRRGGDNPPPLSLTKRKRSLSEQDIDKIFLDDEAGVQACSDPKLIITPRAVYSRRRSSKKEEIEEAVTFWSGREDIPLRSQTSFKKLRKHFSSSKGQIRESLELLRNRNSTDLLEVISPRQSRKSRRTNRTLSRSERVSAKFTFQDRMMDPLEMDPRITDEVSLFYIRQMLPNMFPLSVLQYLYSKLKIISCVHKYLIDRGWTLEIPPAEDCSVPSYYFGSWSFDCWIVFENCDAGSFITCHKQNRYYLMHKTQDGKVVLNVMKKGPRVSNATTAKYELKKGIPRPPKRFICSECSKNTPCELLQKTEPHLNVFQQFVISFPPKTSSALLDSSVCI